VPQIEFQARVLARLETQEPVNDKSSWLMIGQAGLALILVAYAWLVNPIELSLEYIPIWMDRLLQFLLSTTDEVLLGIEESFQQFLALSPTRSELFASVPEIPLGGTLLIYAVLLAVLLWIVSNHLLFQTNGQHEESQS
jgi:hypothetical protein